MRKFFTLLLCNLFFYNLLFCQHIEEFDYDQPGADASEFIDIFLPSGSNVNDFQIILYNGSNSDAYSTINGSSLTCVNVTGGQICTWDPAGSDNIQNGAPDGIILYNSTSMNIIQGISYEGDFTPDSGIGNGYNLTPITVSEDNNAPNLSISFNSSTGDYILTSPNQGALPVNFNNFNIKGSDSYIKIYFSTASETNNSHFNIERSADARNFEAIYEIKGAGNSSREITYSFTDEKPLPGINYYRIKQTDFDGQYSYSEIRSVRHKGLGNVSVTPRTTEGRLDITTALEDYTIAIYNAAGQEVKRMVGMSLDQNISIEALNPGVYFVKINSGSESETVRVVKI